MPRLLASVLTRKALGIDPALPFQGSRAEAIAAIPGRVRKEVVLRKQWRDGVVAASVLVGTLSSCGGGGEGDPGESTGGISGSNSSGAGGAASMAGSAAGGTTGGGAGSAGAAVGGRAANPMTGTCAPEPKPPELGPMNYCFTYDYTTIPRDRVLDIGSYPLKEPLVAGQKNAVYLEPMGAGISLEIWGTDMNCGAGLEKLVSQDLASGQRCFELTPTSAYPELIVVLRGSNSNQTVGYSNIAVCSGGTCR
ncbi:MAG TPA: hypothetical protein VER33_25470 [Polyangiaceae bacterium]|nr:hypothetical protein [Polyangiaceae bacterium]